MSPGSGFMRDWAVIAPALSTSVGQTARELAARTGIRASRVGFRLTMAQAKGWVEVEYRRREGRGLCTEVRGVYRLRQANVAVGGAA
jgi:predicted ArsR family transcriptional regulator